MARRVFVNEVVDPATEGFYCEAGSRDSVFRHLAVKGLFFVRSSERITIERGEVGGVVDRGVNTIGAATGGQPCKGIVVRDLLFHDMQPPSTTDHHEALFVSEVDGLLLENCRFERIYANTADVYFTAVSSPRSAKNVTVRGCYFGRPTNGRGNDAIQFGGGQGDDPHDGFLIEGCLFDGCKINFGTLVRPVKNFVVGVNYGDLPRAHYDAARAKGVEFREYPFRPASEWPGAIVEPPPPPPPPPDPDPPAPVDPCAAVRDELVATQGMLATANGQIALLQSEVVNLSASVADRQGRLDRIRAILDEA